LVLVQYVDFESERLQKFLEENRELGYRVETCKELVDKRPSLVQRLVVHNSSLFQQFAKQYLDDNRQHFESVLISQFRDTFCIFFNFDRALLVLISLILMLNSAAKRNHRDHVSEPIVVNQTL
jgi:hypothetical protein